MKYFAILLIVLLGNQSVASAERRPKRSWLNDWRSRRKLGKPKGSAQWNDRRNVTPEWQLQFDLGRSRRRQGRDTMPR